MILGGISYVAVFASCSSSPSANAPSDASTDAASMDDAGDEPPVEPPLDLPPWLTNAKPFVHAADDPFLDCRTVICRHNENTDLTTWNGAIYLVHRTAISQTLGPNSALHVYRSTDSGVTFVETARIDAPTDRDIRDPCFYQVGGELYVKALTRLPVASSRDSNVDTVAVAMHSSDGVTWAPQVQIGPHGQSFWRIREQAGVYYTASYQDGDKSVTLYTSTDGVVWTSGASIYIRSADTPLETELMFIPGSGSVDAGASQGDRMLALVRMDGTDTELLGDEGRLRTKICWASAPYATFDCSAEIDGQRLDGPVAFFWGTRLFVVARKHLQGMGKKRTSLFELTGDFAHDTALSIKEWGEVPSAGDTSYAGYAPTDATHGVITWYSGDRARDRPWVVALFDPTDIWQGTIDFSKLQ